MSEAEEDRMEVVVPFAEVYIKEEPHETEVKVGTTRWGMSGHKPHFTVFLRILSFHN